ncbi:RNA polymerase sigma factor [Maribacter sp. CXY002]|uniref:RNA polymerase sigma factor n=1 Tax=Maribacter luteocoastalis TaxID=3407671 RepID=UPI003B67607F
MANQRVFADLIRQHQGLLYKVTSIYTNNKEDQEDLFQEVVYQLWKYFDTFREESKVTTWMYRVAMNTAITYLKKSKKKGSCIPIADTILVQTNSQNEVFEERLRLLYTHIGHLSQMDKGLMLFEGKSYKEMAVITGLNPSNVGTRISRIKEKLKQNMTKS